MIEIRIMVDEIDYKTALKNTLPAVKERLANSEDSSPLKKSLSALVSVFGTFGKGFIGIVSNKTRDKLAVKLVNSKQDLFRAAIENIAEHKGIDCKIKSISAEYVDNDTKNIVDSTDINDYCNSGYNDIDDYFENFYE